jgi:hypothetical protein
MRITRVHAGFVLIGVSIVLFLIAGSIDDPETQMSVAGEAFLGNFLSIAAAVIGLGVYLAYFSKPCPARKHGLKRCWRNRRSNKAVETRRCLDSSQWIL